MRSSKSLVMTLAMLATAGIASAACDADLGNDGSVGFSDLQILLQNWGACPMSGPCPADIGGNGNVGFGDLQMLLQDWGPCPVEEVSCCFQGNCSIFESEADCTGAGGTVVESCEPNPCEPPPDTSCCVFGGCSDLNPKQCIALGGFVVQGSCADDPCP